MVAFMLGYTNISVRKFMDWYPQNFLWNGTPVNATETHWYINIGSGIYLVPVGNVDPYFCAI